MAALLAAALGACAPPGFLEEDSAAASADAAPRLASALEPQVLVAMVFHLEPGTWARPEEWQRRARDLEFVLRRLEAHGARATLEVSAPFVRTAATMDPDFIRRVARRGHEVAVHADLGGRPEPSYTQERFTRDLLLRRLDLESMGVAVDHVSGMCSHLDWVEASLVAGYTGATSIVSYCLMALPEEDRPPEYRDCADARACHDPWPETVADRLVPWATSDGASWVQPDPQGELLVMPGEGLLGCLAEPGGTDIFDCHLEPADLDIFFANLEEAISLARPGRVNSTYLTWSVGGTPGQELDRVLDRMDPYLTEGRVRWATIRDIEHRFWE